MGIVVIGAVFVDIKGYPLSTYIPGGRNSGRVEQVHGGVSRNIVEDIANVELRPTFVGLVDDTGMGQDVIDKLRNHKVNTQFIRRVKDGMGTWLAVFNNDGDVCASISKRPDTTPLTALLKEQGDEIFKDCDSIALELDLEKETVKQVLRFAKKYNKRVYAAISNMSIAMERRDFLQQVDCFVCNQQEAGLLFSDDYDHLSPAAMREVLAANVHSANIPCMVVTMGGQGAVYARANGESGVVPAKKVDVIDTTGAGDAFFAGTVIGLTYGKNLPASCEIGSRLAASVISITENVCPVSARWNSGWTFPCWTELHPKAPEHSRKRECSGACFFVCQSSLMAAVTGIACNRFTGPCTASAAAPATNRLLSSSSSKIRSMVQFLLFAKNAGCCRRYGSCPARSHAFCCLYCSPHTRMASMMGCRLRPSGVRLYSTRGGTSG